MASSSSNAPSPKKYDMFISFRGEDTRTSFTSHLHSAFCRHNIKTYIDYKLTKGDDIWQTLCEAIEQSHISVVVFSSDYAGSKWCLEELVKILECRKDQGQVVIPVFYQTDPSDVRKQTGTYGEAFAKHDRGAMNDESNRQKVSNWKAALEEAASIAGWHSRSYNDDSEVIEKIIVDVLQKLSLRYPNELKGLVPIDKSFKRIELLLNTAQSIGIWGMSGIGKTTLARAVFAKHFPHYDTACFLENVRESQKLGPTYSRDKLLFELLKEENPQRNASTSTFVTRRLRTKRGLIVLDDVSSFEQLEDLRRYCGELGSGSKLIITARDKTLLREVDEICELSEWNFQQSLVLFSQYAFKTSPGWGYEHLIEQAVNYAGGVPLALKVLGSYLRSKSPEIWESALGKLEKYPNEKIDKVLKEVFEELDFTVKNIFLDIAFFFKNEYKDDVERILNACDFYATCGIDVLVDKTLVTISNLQKILMHDLIQETALNIVREECNKNPGGRSRLRDVEEVHDVLQNDKGTHTVEGIIFDLSQIEDLQLSAEALNLMPNLRFLKLHNPSGEASGNVCLPKDLKPLSNKMRYFGWNGYSLKSLPPTFCAKFLVEICMPHSKVEELWQRKQGLKYLERIDLRQCKQLVKLPDLSGAPNLKWVYLHGCESLCDLHPSILSCDKLETLILDRCVKLRSLKSEKHSKSLKMLSVNGCSGLKEFSVSSDLIDKLDLSKTAVEILHSSIGRLSKLNLLNLEGLRLQNLPNELSCLEYLEDLRISNTELVIDKYKLTVLFDGLRSLKVLYLKDCCNLRELPDNISVLSSLRDLRLDGSNVETLPASVKHLQELEILSLKNCRKLRYLPELPPFIKECYAVNCTSLTTVSTLKTFAAEMKGKRKSILFQNGMNLDEHSFHCIMEGAQLTMMSAAFHNILVRRYSVYTHSYNYNRAEICLSGSKLPKHFPYRTTESSITIKLPSSSQLLGFIFALVLSPSSGMKRKHGASIQCQCYLVDGTRVGYETKWCYEDVITGLDSEHVFVKYDPLYCDDILREYERHVTFDFCATTGSGKLDGLIDVKECGIRLIYYKEFHRFLRQLGLDRNVGLDRKVELGLKLKLAMDMELRVPRDVERPLLNALEQGLEMEASLESEYVSRREAILRAIENYGEKESDDLLTQTENKEWWEWKIESQSQSGSESGSELEISTATEGPEENEEGNDINNQINNQEQDSSEKCSSNRILALVPTSKSVMVEPEQAEEVTERKDPLSDVKEESIESAGKESKTSAIPKAVVLVKSKESRGTPTASKSDAGSHQPTAELVQVDRDKSGVINSDLPDNKEEAEHLEKNQNLQIIVHPDHIHYLTVEEIDQEKENEAMDLDKPGGQEESDHEKPFAEIESIVLESHKKSSPKEAAGSTSFVTSDVVIKEALHNLGCLLQNSLASILSDVQLQRQLHISLKCIEASREKVSPSVAKLVESMTSSIDDMLKIFALTQKVVEDHSSRLQHKKRLAKQTGEGKKRQKGLNETMSQCKFEADPLEKEAEELEEQKKTVEMKQTELKDEANNLLTGSKKVEPAIASSQSSYDAAITEQQKLEDKWEGFRTAFAGNFRDLS